MKILIWCLAFIVAVIFLLTRTGPGTIRAEVLSVRVTSWTNPQGRALHQVLIDWKNTGTTPIRVVHANIDLFDTKGHKMMCSVQDHAIYTVFDGDAGISPGNVFSEPLGKGYVAAPVWNEGAPASANVKLTRVSSEGSHP